MFSKVKAAAISAALAIIAAVVTWAAGYDWAQLGPWAPIIAAAIPVGAAYLKKELAGYGSGVPVPEDEIPGGEPLPTGADLEAP